MKPFSKMHGKKMGPVRHIFSLILGGALVCLIAVAAVGTIYTAYLFKTLPSPNQLGNRQISQSTKIYDKTGEILLYEIHGEEKRTVIPFETIPDTLKKATLAAENANFYSEPAFDWKAILRAGIANIRQGRITQGGSTISQQLVKNVFLSSERTFTRKIKELILAIRLESEYSKDEIFSFYLNQIPYGSNAYGVEAASQTFFGKPVKELSLAESAALASLPKAPSYYSPWGSHIKELMSRKNYVLDQMVSAGSITKEDAVKAKKVVLKFAPPSLGAIKAPHFSLAVKDYLISKYGENVVMNGGLKVITTLDWPLQDLAEKVVSEGVQRNTDLYDAKNGALVAQDPKTGQILAMVGSKDYFDIENGGNFNVATQGLRQPGSALKPFVYMTAFQKGYSPKTVLFDTPIEFDTRNDGDPTHSYAPQNFDGLFRGPVSMEQSLPQSLNVPAVETLYLAGFDDVLKNLHAFGITSLNERWRYGLSLTLGGGEVKLVDLVNTYATLSQEGIHHAQTMVLKVQDGNGNTLEEYNDQSNRVIDPQYPRLITQILSDPQLRAPLYQSSLSLTIFPDHEVALKTGTTEDYRDAWAFGYTPSLAIGVWAGNNDNVPMTHKGSSILAAVPMWSAFLKEALIRYPSETFPKPDPLILPSKPMLNGEPVMTIKEGSTQRTEAHSILYYVDRNNPTGPIPQNPSDDPQFENWERSVQTWVAQNPASLYAFAPSTFRISTPTPEIKGPERILSIEGLNPGSGEFVTSPFVISAHLVSNQGLKRVELYYNRRLIHGADIGDQSFPFRYKFELPLEAQNEFTLKIWDQKGGEAEKSTLLFR